jgi:hypothetical protein
LVRLNGCLRELAEVARVFAGDEEGIGNQEALQQHDIVAARAIRECAGNVRAGRLRERREWRGEENRNDDRYV